MVTDSEFSEARRLAITAEALYLANLLLLPLLAFLILWWLAHRYGSAPHPLALNHLSQSLRASLWAGLLLVPLPLLVVWLSNNSLAGWTAAILWFIACHAALVLAGAVGVARAMAGKSWHYPLIGGKAP